jgi:hypothetical protein
MMMRRGIMRDKEGEEDNDDEVDGGGGGDDRLAGCMANAHVPSPPPQASRDSSSSFTTYATPAKLKTLRDMVGRPEKD